MADKIERLTDEQAARLPAFRDEWLKWGICADRADRPKAEAAISEMRSLIGEPAAPFIWVDSPMTGCLAIAALQDKSLGDSLRASLWASLGASLRASLGDSLGASLWASLADSFWGQQESYWIAYYLFCRDVLGVVFDPERSRQLDLWRDVAQSCCWWWGYEHAVIISERPTICRLDDAGALHNQTGPAVAFADGFAVHAWHGTRVPKEWIEQRETLTPAIALSQENTERRRAACEILGWDTILRDLKAKTIDRDPDEQIGELVEVSLPGSGKERFLRVLCGTGRQFAIPVPRDMKTALQAQAWTWGLDEKTFVQPEVRT